MDAISVETKIEYTGLLELMEKLTKETQKLTEYQNKMLKQNLALNHLNKSFNQAQSRLERIAAAKCGSELLNL